MSDKMNNCRARPITSNVTACSCFAKSSLQKLGSLGGCKTEKEKKQGEIRAVHWQLGSVENPCKESLGRDNLHVWIAAQAGRCRLAARRPGGPVNAKMGPPHRRDCTRPRLSQTRACLWKPSIYFVIKTHERRINPEWWERSTLPSYG